MTEFTSLPMAAGAHIDEEQEETIQSRGGRMLARILEVIGILRNFVRLLIGLLLDKRVDRSVKIFVGAVLAYIAAPADFIPELFSGLFGFADDFVLTAFALNVLLNWVDPEVVRSHWRGKNDLLETVQKGIKNAEILVPDAILKKIQVWIGKRAPQQLVPVQMTPTSPEVEKEAGKSSRKKKQTRKP